MQISRDEAFRLAREIAESIVGDFELESLDNNVIPKIKPGAVWVGYKEKPSGTEIDLIVKAHHGFLSSTLQFPLNSLIAMLLVEADEMFLDDKVQQYFRITAGEVESVRNASVRVFAKHFLDSLFRTQRFHIPTVLEQSIVTIANTVGKQQWALNIRLRPQPADLDSTPEWFLKETDIRYAFRTFPDVPFGLLKLVESVCRPENDLKERLRKGGAALFDQNYLVEEHLELKNAYNRLKLRYNRALGFSERRRRHNRATFDQKWADWTRWRYPNLLMAASCNQFAAYKLSHHHLARIYEKSPSYIEELLRKLRKSRPL